LFVENTTGRQTLWYIGVGDHKVLLLL